ncbi:MAG: hypothetical protein AAF989_08705 [Planctomycetota bacterium]
MPAFRLRNVILSVATLGVLFYGSLSIANHDLGHLNGICGPWGCLAAVAPLLSVHCMWLVVTAGAGTLVRITFARARPRRFWIYCFAFLGLLGVAAWGYQMFEFSRIGGQFSSLTDVPKFLAYHAIRCTDFPFAELALTSLVHACLPWKSFATNQPTAVPVG